MNARYFSLVAVAVCATAALFSQFELATAAGVSMALVMPQVPGFDAFYERFADKLGYRPGIQFYPLYDYVVYPTAGSGSIAFFSNGVGGGKTSSSGAVAAAAKTIHDTNLKESGKLSDFNYIAGSIEVDFQPGSSAAADTYAIQRVGGFAGVAAAAVQAGEDDVNAVYSSGILRWKIGDDIQVENGPLYQFPPMKWFEFTGALASNSATTGEIVKGKLRAAGAPFSLPGVIGVEKARNFTLTLDWPAAIATPSGFNGRIGVRINGWRLLDRAE